MNNQQLTQHLKEALDKIDAMEKKMADLESLKTIAQNQMTQAIRKNQELQEKLDVYRLQDYRNKIIAILMSMPKEKRLDECVRYYHARYESFRVIFMDNIAVSLADQMLWFCKGAGLI